MTNDAQENKNNRQKSSILLPVVDSRQRPRHKPRRGQSVLALFCMDWFLAWIMLLTAFTVGYFLQHAIYTADFPTLTERDRREVVSLRILQHQH